MDRKTVRGGSEKERWGGSNREGETGMVKWRGLEVLAIARAGSEEGETGRVIVEWLNGVTVTER